MATRAPADRAAVALALVGVVLGGAVTLLVGALDATIVVTGAVAAVALVVMLAKPELPVHAVLLVLYTNAAVAAAQESALAGAVAGGVVALLGIPLARYLVLDREPLRIDGVFWLMLVLLGVFCVSAALAVDAGTALDRIVSFVSEGLLLYFLIVNVVRTLPTLRRAVCTVLVAGSLLGALTLFQTVTGEYDQEFMGLAQRSVAFALSDAPNPSEAESDEIPEGVVSRAGGPVDEPNRFAQMLIVLLPLALYQLRFGRSRSSRLFGLLSGLLILSGVLLTYSRGAFLTLAVLAALSAALGSVRPSRVAIAVVAMLLAVPWVAPGYYDRVGSIGDALDVLRPEARLDAEAVARGRTTETLAAFHAFLDHPVVGVGPGHYLPHYSVRYQLDPDIGLRFLPEPRRAHNLFAEMAAESGIAGLLVFASIPLLLLRKLWVRRRGLMSYRPDLAHLATAFGLGILGYLGTGIFLHLAFERYYWLLLALAAATCHVLPGGELDRARS